MTEHGSDPHPDIIGDVVFGSAESPVAVCTLATRRLLPLLAGRPEIAIAGRVFTENVGVERMIQNLVAAPRLRYLIVCGRESPHKVGQTILALHRAGLDEQSRVIGSEAPEPFLPNLSGDQLQAFRSHVTLVDLIGVEDADEIVAHARGLLMVPAVSPSVAHEISSTRATVDVVASTPDPPTGWAYDPVGFFLIFVDWARQQLRLEQYSQDRRLLRVFEGTNAQEICHTILRHEQVTLLAHAAYLGRELAKAETAMRLGLEYEQDSPLREDRPWPRMTGSAG